MARGLRYTRRWARLFYGVLFAMVFIVRSSNYPGWVLPLAGAMLFAVLVGLWITSAF